MRPPRRRRSLLPEASHTHSLTRTRERERERERERRESGEPLLLARIGPRRRGELGSWGDSRPEHLFHPSIRFPCRLLFLLRATPLSQGEKPVRQPAGWCGWCGFGIHEARRTFCGSASLSLSHFPEFVYNLQYSVCSCGCVNAPQSIQNPVKYVGLWGYLKRSVAVQDRGLISQHDPPRY